MNKTLGILLFLLPISVYSAEPDVAQLEWLVGHWQGDGFGGTSEEIWSPARDGVMMGMFRHHKADGSLNFYEFMTIDSDGLKLKHFNPDMTGWEEKDDYLTFRFDEQMPGKIVFKGLSFERVDDDAMRISLKMKRGDESFTEVFNMRRVGNLPSPQP